MMSDLPSNNYSMRSITVFRTCLMGCAIACIMICHNSLSFGIPVLDRSWDIFRKLFQSGVDIFFFLSGLGLYYSCKKDSNVLHFYWKRIKRIVPVYILLVGFRIGFGIVFGQANIPLYVKEYSLISFFSQGVLNVWFISAILVLYIVFPVLYRLLSRYPKIFRLLFFLTLIIPVGWATAGWIYNFSPPTANSIFFVRIPVFMLGMFVGKKLDDFPEFGVVSAKVVKLLIVGSALAAVFNLCFNPYSPMLISRLIFLVLAPSLCLFLCHFFSTCAILNHGTSRFAESAAFLGGITLEIYLIHEWLLGKSDKLFQSLHMPVFVTSLISNLLSAILAIAAAWMCHKTYEKLKSLKNIR